MCYRMVLEMLYHSMVPTATDCTNGCADGDGCVVGMCVLHQDSRPVTVCCLSQRCNHSHLQLHRHWGSSVCRAVHAVCCQCYDNFSLSFLRLHRLCGSIDDLVVCLPVIALEICPNLCHLLCYIHSNSIRNLFIMAARQLAGRRPLYFTADVSILFIFFFVH